MPARIKRRWHANQPGIGAGKLNRVCASLKSAMAAGMRLRSNLPRRGRRVKATYIIASGSSAQRQGPANIAKAEHGQSPAAEAWRGGNGWVYEAQTHDLMIVFIFKKTTYGYVLL